MSTIPDDQLTIGQLREIVAKARNPCGLRIDVHESMLGGAALNMANVEADTLRAERDEALKKAREEMLFLDTPQPLTELLDEMARDLDHLLAVHDCDHHGWEGTERRSVTARDYACRLRALTKRGT